MGNLNVYSLYPKNSSNETIGIWANNLFQDIDKFEGLNRNEGRKLLHLLKKKSHFLFNESYISKLMGRLWDHRLEFLCSMHQKIAKRLLKTIETVSTVKYFDIVVLFESPKQLIYFRNNLNPEHPNMSIPSECESNNRLCLFRRRSLLRKQSNQNNCPSQC